MLCVKSMKWVSCLDIMVNGYLTEVLNIVTSHGVFRVYRYALHMCMIIEIYHNSPPFEELQN
jgi:hypothetical protein